MDNKALKSKLGIREDQFSKYKSRRLKLNQDIRKDLDASGKQTPVKQHEQYRSQSEYSDKISTQAITNNQIE